MKYILYGSGGYQEELSFGWMENLAECLNDFAIGDLWKEISEVCEKNNEVYSLHLKMAGQPPQALRYLQAIWEIYQVRQGRKV